LIQTGINICSGKSIKLKVRSSNRPNQNYFHKLSMKKRKADKKSIKKQDRKELQSNIAQRFLDAVNNLGHDAERIAKDLKKMSKQIAEKLSKIDKTKEKKGSSKKPVELLVAKAEEKGLKKRAGRARAEKVVAKVVSRKPRNGKAAAAKPLEKVQSVEVPEVQSRVTRSRGRVASVKPAEEQVDQPVKRRGRRPASEKGAEVAKPVVRRGPRKKVTPSSIETEVSPAIATDSNDQA
jgi:hypothetical protein